MKKIIYFSLTLLLTVILFSCGYKNNTGTKDNEVSVEYGSAWDGNYIYYNGYKTKTNSGEKIYFLKTFKYNDKDVEITDFLDTEFYFGDLHLIVNDASGKYYYLRYDFANGKIINTFSYFEKISLEHYNHKFYLYVDGNRMYIYPDGIYPAIDTQNFTVKEDVMLFSEGGILFYAKINDEKFTQVTDNTINDYTIDNGKIYYIYSDKYNIFDINTGENHVFELEPNFKSLLNNGSYFIKTDYFSDNEIDNYYIFSLIFYDGDNKITVDMPQNYNFSSNKDFNNLVGVEYRGNNLYKYCNFRLNENNEPEKVPFGTIETETESDEYYNFKCGIYTYYYSYKHNNQFEKYETYFYGLNTETGEKHLCFKVSSYNYYASIGCIYTVQSV